MIDINLTKKKNCNTPILVGGIGEKNFGNHYKPPVAGKPTILMVG